MSEWAPWHYFCHIFIVQSWQNIWQNFSQRQCYCAGEAIVKNLVLKWMITIDHICLTTGHNNLNLATSSTCQKILGRLHTASSVRVLVEFPVNMYKQVTALQPSTNTSFTTNQSLISIYYVSIIYTDCQMLLQIEAHFMIQWAENQLQIWIFSSIEGFRGKKSHVINNFDCSVQLIRLISYYHKIEWPDGIQLGVTQILFLEKRPEF